MDHVEIGALMRCLSAIEERARDVVLLSFHEGRDAAEVATILATTSGNVRVIRHRAVAALRRGWERARREVYDRSSVRVIS